MQCAVDTLRTAMRWALQGLSGQVIVLTFILMGILLYKCPRKHRDRAGEFLRSFASFEGSLRKQPDGAAGGDCFARLRGCMQVSSQSSCALSFGYGPPLEARLFSVSSDARLFASV